LNRALIELDNNQETRVVIIKGEGKAFSAGIDISEFFGKSQREYYQWVSQMEQMNMVISYMKKPVIACAKGFAVANGAGLIAACDLAVVSEGIKIGATAINVGLFCMGPAVPMSRSLGRKRSRWGNRPIMGCAIWNSPRPLNIPMKNSRPSVSPKTPKRGSTPSWKSGIPYGRKSDFESGVENARHLFSGDTSGPVSVPTCSRF